MRNVLSGEAAAAPTNATWAEVQFFTRQGEFVLLRGGDRLWGPWLDRQVWEVTRVPAGEGTVRISLEAGKGEQPKPTLEQLLGVRTVVAPPEGAVAARRGGADGRGG